MVIIEAGVHLKSLDKCGRSGVSVLLVLVNVSKDEALIESMKTLINNHKDE